MDSTSLCILWSVQLYICMKCKRQTFNMQLCFLIKGSMLSRIITVFLPLTCVYSFLEAALWLCHMQLWPTLPTLWWRLWSHRWCRPPCWSDPWRDRDHWSGWGTEWPSPTSPALRSSCTQSDQVGLSYTRSKSAGSTSRSSTGDLCCCTRTHCQTARLHRSSPRRTRVFWRATVLESSAGRPWG